MGTGFGATFQYYSFSQNISAVDGISSFTVDVQDAGDGPVTSYNNGGGGFPISDVVIVESTESCFNAGTKKLSLVALVSLFYPSLLDSGIHVELDIR